MRRSPTATPRCSRWRRRRSRRPGCRRRGSTSATSPRRATCSARCTAITARSATPTRGPGSPARKDRAGVRAAARVLPAPIAALAEALVALWGPAEATLARAAQLAWPDDVRAALDRLQTVVAALAELAD